MREKDEFPATGCDTGVYTVMQREVNAINHVWLRSKTNDSAQNHLIPVPPYSHRSARQHPSCLHKYLRFPYM